MQRYFSYICDGTQTCWRIEKKLNLRSGSQRHRLFNVPVQTRHGANLFIRLFRDHLVAFYDTLGIRTWKVIYHWRRQPYFFYRTGFLLGVCHGWFHLRGLTRSVRNADRELQNEKFLPTVGFEPGTFRFRSERANCCATRADVYRALINLTAFYHSLLLKFTLPRGRCS